MSGVDKFLSFTPPSLLYFSSCGILASQAFKLQQLLYVAVPKTLGAARQMSAWFRVVNFHLFIAVVLGKVFVAKFQMQIVEYGDK